MGGGGVSVAALSRCALTLTTREWLFGADDSGPPQSVTGAGVIGLHPRLEAPSSVAFSALPALPPFEYASLTEIKSPPGWMEGALNFELEGMSAATTHLRATIARFDLDLPPFVFS